MPKVLNPAHWAAPKGYANGMTAEGRLVFLAGQIGWDSSQQLVDSDFVAQAEQALRNILELLAEADAGPEHLVRMTWYVTDRSEYLARSRELGEAYRRVMGRNFPAMSAVQVVALMESGAKVEIEATAVVPAPSVDSRAG